MIPHGELAQLGERFHGMEEVIGSIPLFSTKVLTHSNTMLSRNCGKRLGANPVNEHRMIIPEGRRFGTALLTYGLLRIW